MSTGDTTASRPDLARLVNLRDVGGMPTGDGRLTRTGVLYRSEAPRRDDWSPSADFEWPPRTVIDLRSPVERGSGAHPLASDRTAVHVIPLLGDVDPTDRTSSATRALSGGLDALYLAILSLAAEKVVQILHLAVDAPAPLLVHCAAGKDRTGLVVAVLLRAAGVETDAVLTDYAATATNMPGVLSRMGAHPLLPVGGGMDGPDMTGISAPAVERVLAIIDGHCGGARGWLADNGARPGAVHAWESRLLS
ncbi:tyrosine-protein phosphatase [Frankia sp. Cppng1_Ct_nod]|uniref:tyrosine-protein phosphatase n=1 Tax=Frankia sp. Cppng1_Ct_nod TaxID=2897162 RepID=UPI001040F84F|nr:tyrosine-protein phosphatase [Frankia sp. Cppng1_Ct_nod]